MAMSKSGDTYELSALLESLRRENITVLRRRDEFLSQHAEKIRFNYFRGMSRGTLVAKYGESAVVVAIGAKGTPDPCLPVSESSSKK